MIPIRTIFLTAMVGILMLLQSCLPDLARTNTLRPVPPDVLVSTSRAAPGEFIEVTVQTGVALNYQSTIPENSTTFDFGICFIPRKSSTTQGCPPDTSFILPEGIVIKQGESHVVPIEVTVKRGESVSVEHKFSFTTSSPMEVTLVGRGVGPTTNSASLDGRLTSVTFE